MTSAAPPAPVAPSGGSGGSNAPAFTAVRFRFAKQGKVRWTSHRDVARMWERALRRAGLPVARTAGFSPRPRLHFGLALSTGHESLAEYLDVDLAAEGDRLADAGALDAAGVVDVGALPERLSPCLPIGIDVTAAALLPGGSMSLQQAVTSCEWQFELDGVDEATAEAAVATALAASELKVTRTRKGQESIGDVRPGILRLAVLGSRDDGSGAVVRAELATQPRAVRPGELLDAVVPDRDPERIVRVLRTHQWIDDGGARREPLPVDATPTRLAVAGP